MSLLNGRRPVFVYFNNYFRVRPLIHLGHLAARLEQNLLDGDQYDFGNQCLLALLSDSLRVELSRLGCKEPGRTMQPPLQAYRDQLDRRAYKLNAAEVGLS